MANNADGSIVIDTELDNSGFDRGAEQLTDQIDSIIEGINSINSNIKKSMSQISPTLQSIATSAQGIFNAMSAGSDQAVTAGERATATQQNMAQSAEATTQALQQQGQTINNLSTAGSSSLSALEREVDSLTGKMASISQSAEMGFANGKAVLAFDSKLTDISNKLSEAKTKVEEFGNTKIPTEDYTWLQQAIKKAEDELNRYIEKQITMEDSGVSKSSARWKTLQTNIDQATRKLETYRGELADLEASGEAFTLGSGTQQYAQMQAALKQTEAELNRNKALIDSEAIAQARLNVLAAQEQVAVAQTAAQRQAALAQLQQAQAQLAEAAAASATKTEPPAKSTSGWQKLGTVIKRVGTAAVSTAGKLAKMSFNAITRGAKKAVSSLKAFATQSNKTGLSAKGLVRQLTSLKTMLLTRIKSSFISSIMSAVSQGIQSLAKYSSAFNASMSSIKNSCSQLGGNIAVAFSNIVNAIAPAITTIINMVSQAISYLNAFFAMISGKSTVTVAKKGMEDYAGATGGAAAAQKELNRQVYGFDELNKRNKESDSSGGGGGGAGGIEYEDVPIDSMLPQSVQDWFQRIKDAFEAGDWYGIGQIIAEGLNTAMGKVDDWINKKLRPKGVKWASRIAQILNGLTDGFDWSLLGKTIADGLNAAFDIVNTFLETYNFENLGKGVGTSINSFFANMDWSLVGTTIANGIMAAVNFAHGLVTTIDFLKIGTSIATALNTAISKTDFSKIGATLGGALRGVIQAAFGLIENIDFDKLSEKIKAGAQAFLDKMNAIDPRTGLNGWQELGTAFADLANGIVQAFESVPWGEVAKGVGQTISTALSKSKIEVKLILAALAINGISKVLFGKGVLSLIAGKLGSSILTSLSNVWPTLGGKITGALSSLGTALSTFASTDVLAASAGQIGAAVIGGLFIGGEIGKLIDNHVIGPLIEALGGDKVTAELYKNFHWFGEGGFFDEMWTDNASFLENVQIWGDALGMMFGDIWSGIKSGASTAWSGIKSGLSTAWSGIKSTASTAWNGIKTTVTTAFTNAKTSLSTTANNIKSSISTTWSNIKSATSSAWSNIKTSVTTAFTNAKSSLATTASSIKSNLSSTWSSVKSTATQTWNNIKSSVSSTFTNLKSSLSSTATNIKSTVSSAWTSIKSTATSKWSEISSTVSSKWSNLKSILKSHNWTSIGTNLVSGLKSGISNAWSGLTTSVGNLCSSLLGKVKSAFGIHSPSRAMAEIGGYLDAGMEQGIENGKAGLLKTASNLADAVTDGMTPGSPEIDLSADNTVKSMVAVASQLSGIADTFLTISNVLAHLGELSIPQIAAGTVVPYRTKVDGSEDTTATALLDPAVIQDFAEDVDTRIADTNYLLKQLIEIVKRLHIDIDMDALSRAITKAQRDHSLNYGGV